MPWWNNDTSLSIEWLGLTDAPDSLQRTNDQLNSNGFKVMLTADGSQRILLREYRKLDWLIGMLGGGIFLIFLIGWAACRWISTSKNKYDVC